MAISFSRSIRSLDNDKFLFTLIMLSVMAIILTVWIGWFFLAKITIYETSQTFHVGSDGMLLVEFSPEALQRIRPGQSVLFFPNTTDTQVATSLSGEVMDVPDPTFQSSNSVQVYLNSSIPLTKNVTGQVRIAVDHVSPLMLVLQSVEQTVKPTKSYFIFDRAVDK